MAAAASLFLIVFISILVTRIASVALVLTGLSEDLARFQARSAFTGVGFTTSESENIVNHPVRRRILMILMILGNAGLVSAMASLLFSLIDAEGSWETAWRLIVLALGAGGLWVLLSRKVVNQGLSRVIQWALQRWTKLDIYDYQNLLGLHDIFTIRQFSIDEGSWLEGKTLSESGLREEGALVLTIIRKNGERVGVPRTDATLNVGDQLILYGEQGHLAELRDRKQSSTGDDAHGEAMDKQKQREAAQEQRDKKRKEN